LNALRAVEAVGRHGSVSGAAREMNVSPGAVSRQVTLLEAHFGCNLFVRTQRGLTLSEKGAAFVSNIGSAFDLIDQASEYLLEDRGRQSLTVRSLGAFASEFLLPRLHRFQELYPSIGITLKAHGGSVDFKTDDADAAIIVSGDLSAAWDAVELYRPKFLPVVSPKLLAENGPISDPSDLRKFTLLHSLRTEFGWNDWVRMVASHGVDPSTGHWLETATGVYTVARRGIGVALAQRAHVCDDLVSGNLVAPFDEMIHWPNARSYYLVWPKKRIVKPEIAQFRDWLLDELRQSEQTLELNFPNLRIIRPE
jgi:LysR family glycine cleavage system transcriptional activator